MKKNENQLNNLNNEIKENKKVGALGKNELNAILYKMKKYYNELNKIKLEQNNRLNNHKEKLIKYKKDINEINSLKDIELKEEKISVKNRSTFKESKEEIEKNIITLLNKQNQLSEKYNDEVEYTNTLVHMIKTEKDTFEDLNGKIVNINEKLLAIKYAKKSLEFNREEHVKKQKNLEIVLKSMKEEHLKMDEMLNLQDKNLSKLKNDLMHQEEENKMLNEQIKTKSVDLELKFRKKKEEIIDEIRTKEKHKEDTLNKERYIVKVILGLTILQNYFINKDKNDQEINIKDVLNSEDYKTFIANRYTMYESETSVLNTYSNSKSNNIDQRASTNDPFRASVNDFRKSASDFNNNVNNSTYQTEAKIYLNDLKDKFSKLDVEYASLFNFYTKLINKTSFLHSNMAMFNHKQIEFENKKDLYSKRVREIINKSYKNFDDLINSNSRFNNFMKEYKEEAERKLKLNEKKNDIKLDVPSQYIEFYKKCYNLISELKAFFEFVSCTFDIMINYCNDKSTKDIMKATKKIVKSFLQKSNINNNITHKQYIDILFNNIQTQITQEESNNNNNIYNNEEEIEEKKEKCSDFLKLKKFIFENKKIFEKILKLPINLEISIYNWFVDSSFYINAIQEINITLNKCKIKYTNITTSVKDKHSIFHDPSISKIY
jgi:hypothetical protein